MSAELSGRAIRNVNDLSILIVDVQVARREVPPRMEMPGPRTVDVSTDHAVETIACAWVGRGHEENPRGNVIRVVCDKVSRVCPGNETVKTVSEIVETVAHMSTMLA